MGRQRGFPGSQFRGLLSLTPEQQNASLGKQSTKPKAVQGAGKSRCWEGDFHTTGQVGKRLKDGLGLRLLWAASLSLDLVLSLSHCAPSLWNASLPPKAHTTSVS